MKLTDKMQVIQNAIYQAWGEVRTKSYYKEPLSLWMTRGTETEFLHNFPLGQGGLGTDWADLSKEYKKTGLTFLGMAIEYSDKLTDNQIIMCNGSKDSYGIPKYERLAVIEIKPKTTYEFDVHLEPQW